MNPHVSPTLAHLFQIKSPSDLPSTSRRGRVRSGIKIRKFGVSQWKRLMNSRLCFGLRPLAGGTCVVYRDQSIHEINASPLHLSSLPSLMVLFFQLRGCSAEQRVSPGLPGLAGSAGREESAGTAAANCRSSTTTLWAAFLDHSSGGWFSHPQ